MSANQQPMGILNSQKGFTLIELIIVIVILGILAAAAPKYFDMRVDARKAAVTGLAGAVSGASAIAHAACIVDASCDPTAATGSITLSGTTVALVYGYPAPTAAGIVKAMDYTAGQFNETATGADGEDLAYYTFHLTAVDAGGCEAVYTAATATAAAAITTATTTCNF